MDPALHIRSGWKDPVGKQLTNSTIAKHQRAGWYGPVMKENALKGYKPTGGLVFRCTCGEREGLRYLTYSYLNRPGYICPRCLNAIRKERDQEKELARRVREQLIEIFV